MSALLDVRGLTKTFGGLTAVNDVSFTVETNSITAVIGPNGAGKTTLFNLITGFLKPDDGMATLGGANLLSLPSFKIAAAGLVRTFQLVRLFPDMTLLENMIVGTHLRSRGGLWAAIARPGWARREMAANEKRCRELLAMVGLAEAADRPAKGLTYGQQRLLEVARALAAGPRILLLDEPAAGLNHIETKGLADTLRLIRDGGTTILFIEHDMNMVMSTAEHVVVLDFGRKIAEGAPQQVRDDAGVRQAYLG
jgi:branched-chain amino acid transport system ATP-binding protein